MHTILQSTFGALDQARIAWCLLRVPDSLARPSGDIDMLVDRVDLGRLRDVLTAESFVRVPRISAGYHFLRYDRPTNQWLWLHIVTELAFGPGSELVTGAADGCLERRVRDGLVTVLHPDDAFWALLLHVMIDRQRVAPRHRSRLIELAPQACDDSPLAIQLGLACPPGVTPADLRAHVQHGRWPDLERLAPVLVQTWRRRQAITPQRRVLRRLKRLVVAIRTFRNRRGVSVALLGPDGAGKTSLARHLQTSFIFPGRYIYMGLTGGRLPQVARLRHPLLVVPGRVGIFWWRYLMAQYHLARGRIVVFDRYVFDAMVSPRQQLSTRERIMRWIDGHAVPGPDLVLVLNASADLMFARKGAYDLEQLERWRRDYAALARKLPRVEIVDTSRPPELVRADVSERIWLRYVRRWRIW